jgi:hypothetical protein
MNLFVVQEKAKVNLNILVCLTPFFVFLIDTILCDEYSVYTLLKNEKVNQNSLIKWGSEIPD